MSSTDTHRTITHAETVSRIRHQTAADRARNYRDMLHQADRLDDRGDVIAARKARIQAAEYADTRMGVLGRRIAGIVS